jgi:hypothetical protein
MNLLSRDCNCFLSPYMSQTLLSLLISRHDEDKNFHVNSGDVNKAGNSLAYLVSRSLRVYQSDIRTELIAP